MAITNVLFVSETKIKSFTSVNFNVSPADLAPYILNAQDIYLQNYLGSTYYSELKSQILDSTLTAPNRYILDNYIGQALVNYGLYMALPFLKYKIFNKGVLSPDGETAPGIDLEELKYLRQIVLDTAESYCNKMICYINDNSVDFPTYFSSSILDGNLPDKTTPYFGGLVTNVRKGKYNNYGNCYGENSPNPRN